MKLKGKLKRVVASILLVAMCFEIVPLDLFIIKTYAAGEIQKQGIQWTVMNGESLTNGLSDDAEPKIGIYDGGVTDSHILNACSYFTYDLYGFENGLKLNNKLLVFPKYGYGDGFPRCDKYFSFIVEWYFEDNFTGDTITLESGGFVDDSNGNIKDVGNMLGAEFTFTDGNDIKYNAKLVEVHNLDELVSDFRAFGSDRNNIHYLNGLLNMLQFFNQSAITVEYNYNENSSKSIIAMPKNYSDSYIECVSGSNTKFIRKSDNTTWDISELKCDVLLNGSENNTEILLDLSEVGPGTFLYNKFSKLVSDWVALAKKQVEEEQDQAGANTGDQAAEEVKQQAEKDGTSVQKWFYLINNFFVTGETSDEDNMPNMDLRDYGYMWISDKVEANESNTANYNPIRDTGTRKGEHPGSYDPSVEKVNMEEDLRIRIYYSILRNYLPVKEDVRDKVEKEIKAGALDKRFDLKYASALEEYDPDNPTKVMTPETFPLRAHDSVVPSTSAQTEATQASDLITIEQDKPSLKTTANNFDAIIRYFYYGAITANAEYALEGGGTTNLVKLNEKIDAVIPKFQMDTENAGVPDDDQAVSADIISFESLGLPALPQTKEIGNSYQSIEKYGQIMLALMYIKRWAAVQVDGGSKSSITIDSDDESGGSEEDNSALVPESVQELYADEAEEGDVESKKPKRNSNSGSSTNGRIYKAGAKSRYSGLENISGEDVPVDEATADDFGNPVLDEWLVKVSNEEDESKRKPESNVAGYIQYYIQIYKGLTYLGCKPNSNMYDRWIGPELQRIMQYYDEIKDFENMVSAQVNEQAQGNEQAFPNIFNDEEKSFMAHYGEGVAASATYIPLITNLYDPESWSIIPEESFIDEFHYKYGFLRKALYRDTTANAAMNYYVSGNIGKLTPVTLRDFIENDGSDLVLYIDPKMYRMDKISEKFNLAYSKIQNTEEAGEAPEGFVDSVGHWVANLMDTDAETICKSGSAKVYSQDMANKTDPKGKRAEGWHIFDKNQYLMTDYDIEYFLQGDGSDEDEVQKAFAAVSGVYRDKSVFNIAQNESANPKPVFISSKSLCNMTGATKEEFNTIYNYMMVVNLKNKQGMDYDIDMDMDSPVFIDVYGNICTSSGIVIIPSVSNATLYNSTSYDAANAGVASLYNDLGSEKIKVSWLKNIDMLDSTFQPDRENKFYEMTNKTYTSGSSGGVTLAFANLALSSTNVKERMYEIAYANAMATEASSSGIAGSKFNRRVNMILEVLRGADVEDIDLQKEGLVGATNIDKTGIYIAYRVEQLGKLIMSNSNGNSLLELPNLAFMPGFEYIIVVLFKVLFAVMIVILMMQIYFDGVANTIGMRTIAVFIGTIASIVISVIALPSLINFSYYHINKLLLQDESTYMQMLNLEKSMNGQEISVREASTGQPQTSTKFYLKLDEVRVPWWSVITDVLSSDTFTKMQDIYDNAMEASVYSQFGDGTEDSVIKRGNSMYASVDWLFTTSRVEFASYADSGRGGELADDKTAGYLYQNIPESPKMSYVIPYYAIMDNLLMNVMEYNEQNNVAGYTSIPVGNDNEQILTRGLLKPYFTSFNFMQSDYDLLGLYHVYGINPPKDVGTIFGDEEIERMRRSLWCNYEGLSEQAIRDGLEQLDYEARKFIVENRGMLDKVSDATFIKCMALYLATKHNNIMHVPACRGLEIYAMDTRDIMRLSLANKTLVMKGSQKSFERFCFDTGGTFSIILAGFLEVIYWVTSLIKPTVMIILVGALIFSFIYKKLIRLENNHSVEGYLVSVALICLVNMIYALCIKLSMLIPNYTDNIIMCLIGQVILQIGYSLLLFFIATSILRNLHDIGYYTYKTIYDTHMANKVHTLQLNAQRLMANSFLSPLMSSRRPYNYTNYSRTRNMTGNNILDRMRDNEERRRDNVYNNRR